MNPADTMTVAELIEQLSHLEPGSPVVFWRQGAGVDGGDGLAPLLPQDVQPFTAAEVVVDGHMGPELRLEPFAHQLNATPLTAVVLGKP